MIGMVRELCVYAAGTGVLNQFEQRIQRIGIHLYLGDASKAIAKRSHEAMRHPHEQRPPERVVVKDVQHDDPGVSGEIDEPFRQRQTRGWRDVLQHDDGMDEIERPVYR